MTPIIAIVGRPNVGKSTLFNRLTRTRQALVDDLPGVTRDRLYGTVRVDERRFNLVDTGGFDPPADQAFASEVHAQIELAIAEADAILFVADGRAGLSPLDAEVVRRLRRTEKPVLYAVNKVDGPEHEDSAQEFQALGVDELHFISAAHGWGVRDLVAAILARFPEQDEDQAAIAGLAEMDDISDLAEMAEDALPELPAGPVRVALLGRPNVGKSSLLNALVGGPRVVVSAVPGTTRDAIDTPLTLDERDYVLIDTAGIRRQGRVEASLEKAGVFRSLRAVERSHVVVAVLDAGEGVADQDLRLIGQAVEAHRGLVVVLNKWDLLAGDPDRQKQVAEQAERLTRLAPWAPLLRISAKTKRGVAKVLPAVNEVYAQYCLRMATAPLNQALEHLTSRHQPPMVKGRRLKFFYAAQVGIRPPRVVVFVNEPMAVHFSYRRYLLNGLREAMGLGQAPLSLEFRQRSGRRPRRGRS
ncbi:MAG: ribosome biogenesis GTPase Der [Pseudomonadota bacterium]